MRLATTFELTVEVSPSPTFDASAVINQRAAAETAIALHQRPSSPPQPPRPRLAAGVKVVVVDEQGGESLRAVAVTGIGAGAQFRNALLPRE